MSNRIKQIDRLLKENNFRLQHTGRKGRHLIYVSPNFSAPFFMPPNPVGKEIDWIYAGLKKLIEGHRADSSGRFSMILTTVKAEAAARALPQAHRGRASRFQRTKGTGFRYIDTTSRERTEEEIETARRAAENVKSREERIRAQEEQRRAERAFVDSCQAFVTDEVDKFLQEMRIVNESRVNAWHGEHRANFDGFWTFCSNYMAPESRVIRASLLQKMPQLSQVGFGIFNQALRRSRLCQQPRDENAGRPLRECLSKATAAERADVRWHFDEELAKDRAYYMREFEKKRQRILKKFEKASAEYASRFAAGRLGQSLVPQEGGDEGLKAAQVGVAKWHASMAITIFDPTGQSSQRTTEQTV